MTQYAQRFAEMLQSLNPQQRKAVEQTEGAVMVLAGPGTGKTHILSTRIGQILTTTDTQPYNILCLTFTDAGVQAMRERLLGMMGNEAHKIHIFTFHSFCNKVIQENIDLFGRHDLEAIDDLERISFIRQLLDELPHSHPLRQNDAYFYEKHLQHLFKTMKTEAWASETVTDAIDSYLLDLPQRKEFIYQQTRKGQFEKGTPKTAQIDEATARMNRLRSAALLYSKYQNLLYKNRRYDFDDMVLWVIDAFQRHEFLLRNYQEQYLYILVDEFQDTNGSQNQILQQLLGFWENPNIFVVGDDDQAIYEFQGARLQNLYDFYEKHRASMEVVLLTENYRSTQPILDAAKRSIDNNELRLIKWLQHLGIEKTLIARGKFAAFQNPPTLLAYPNRLYEGSAIAQAIENLWHTGQDLSEIAVIYHQHQQAADLISLLSKRGIPYQVRKNLNVLDTPLIIQIRHILQWLYMETEQPYSGEHLLYQMLYFRFWAFSESDIINIHYSIVQNEEGKKLKWRDVLFSDAPIAQPFQPLQRLLTLLLQDIHSVSVVALTEKLINESGILREANQQADKIIHIQVLATFMDFIKVQTQRNPRLSVGSLLFAFNGLDDNFVGLPMQHLLGTADGVQFTTAHSAKGLEFEQVFLMACGENQWEKKRKGNQNQFALPDTLIYSSDAETNHLEGLRRLFYVACTRAKKHLQISYSRADDKGKTQQASVFVGELALPIQTIEEGLNHAIDAQNTLLTTQATPEITLLEDAHITELLKGFQLSVTALNTYLECPLGFYYEYVLKVPSSSSIFAMYGTAVHQALHLLFANMLRTSDKVFPTLAEFIEYFERGMEQQRGLFPQRDYEQYLGMGKERLTFFYEENIGKWAKNVVVERGYQTHVQGVPIKGTIDKIEFSADGSVNVIDYKTGKLDTKRFQRPTPKNALGGTYYRQLVFYKVLYENHRNNLFLAKSGEIQYLSPNAKGKLEKKKIDFTAEDVQHVTGLITETYEQIQAQNFRKGCGKSDCRWCNFVRQSATFGSLRNEEAEDLDD